jgi:hypothetical protein
MVSGKRLLLIFLSPLLPIFLFALAFDWGIVQTVGNANSVKHILSESGLYNSIIPSVLKQNGQIDTSLGSISATDPLVIQAVNKAVPPANVQKNVEGAIDNIYLWLDGKTPQPTFDINLTGSQGDFAKNLADEVQQKLASLPVCTTPYTATSFDALNATCVPPGISADTAAKALQADLSSGSGFGQASISASDLKGNTPGQSIFSDQLKDAPKQYQALKKTPVILAVLSILTAAALIFLRPTWRAGLRHVGISVVIVGVSMLVFSWLFNAALTKRVVPNLKVTNQALQTNLRQGISDLSVKIEHNYWLFGGVYTLAGAAMIAAPMFLGRPKQAAPAAAENHPGEIEASPPEEHKTKP